MSNGERRGPRRRGIGRVIVTGSSMAPAFLPGDCLLIAYGARRVRPGTVVVVRRPDRLLVKRVAALSGGGEFVTVLGDNRDASTDSARFGPVPRSDVVAVVLLRYRRARRGRRSPG